jgi:hypothetical protein
MRREPNKYIAKNMITGKPQWIGVDFDNTVSRMIWARGWVWRGDPRSHRLLAAVAGPGLEDLHLHSAPVDRPYCPRAVVQGPGLPTRQHALRQTPPAAHGRRQRISVSELVDGLAADRGDPRGEGSQMKFAKVGAGWTKTSKQGTSYILIKLDPIARTLSDEDLAKVYMFPNRYSTPSRRAAVRPPGTDRGGHRAGSQDSDEEGSHAGTNGATSSCGTIEDSSGGLVSQRRGGDAPMGGGRCQEDTEVEL